MCFVNFHMAHPRMSTARPTCPPGGSVEAKTQNLGHGFLLWLLPNLLPDWWGLFLLTLAVALQVVASAVQRTRT